MRDRQPLLAAPLICTAILLTACASRCTVSQAASYQGAREGTIVRDYALPGSPALPGCLAQLPEEELADRHFVQVKYHRTRHTYFDAAQLPANLRAQLGDRVEIWTEECSAGKYGYIAQVFPQQHR